MEWYVPKNGKSGTRYFKYVPENAKLGTHFNLLKNWNNVKFKFKIQQYQTEAVENTVNVFAGQPAQQGQKGYRVGLGRRDGRLT